MRKQNLLALLVLPLALIFGAALRAAAPPPELGRRGLVASDHLLASQAGAEMLRRGGNAVDAAVATALAAGVVQPSASGIGGGGFALIVAPDGTPNILDFREVAPAAATQDMFMKASNPKASTKGGMAVAVPGEPAGLEALVKRWGRLPLKVVVEPAVRLAAEGFPVGAHLAESLGELKERGTDVSMGLFGAPVPARGERVRRLKLAETLRAYGRSGVAAFHGAIGRDLVASVQALGGPLTEADLVAYTPKDREPVLGAYKGWKIVSMPPPSSGGAVLLQVLGVLEGFDLVALGHNSADTLHLYAEAFKHAYADRARLMGDPDRVNVPLSLLLSPERILEIRRAIVPGRTFPPERYGTAAPLPDDAGTQHISVLDAEGRAVALTTTINTSFGSEVFGARSGVLLNNEMDDFAARPGEPNAFGLQGGAANAVSPGARPLSSMSPTVLISPDGERVVIGASGGPFIISSVVQVIVNMVEFRMDPAEAVAAPRIHHQWKPELLFVDDGISRDTARALEARGHTLRALSFFSAVQVVRGRPGEALGASDPRKGGAPAGP